MGVAGSYAVSPFGEIGSQEAGQSAVDGAYFRNPTGIRNSVRASMGGAVTRKLLQALPHNRGQHMVFYQVLPLSLSLSEKTRFQCKVSYAAS